MQSPQDQLTREEWELVSYFRGLPVSQQLDILSTAESHFNAVERMKELSTRQIERRTPEELHEWH